MSRKFWKSLFQLFWSCREKGITKNINIAGGIFLKLKNSKITRMILALLTLYGFKERFNETREVFNTFCRKDALRIVCQLVKTSFSKWGLSASQKRQSITVFRIFGQDFSNACFCKTMRKLEKFKSEIEYVFFVCWLKGSSIVAFTEFQKKMLKDHLALHSLFDPRRVLHYFCEMRSIKAKCSNH